MNRYPQNPAIRRAQAEGYEYTGCVSRGSWDKGTVEERVAEYKVMGNKVKILLKKEVTSLRDRTDVNSYWCLYVKYSEEYKAFKKAERETKEKARRELALVTMANECTLEEIQFMLNFKIAAMMQEKLNVVEEVKS